MIATARRQLGMAGALAKSLAAFHLGGAPRPFSATFAVTNRCNLRCDYCNFPYLDPSELELLQIRKLFDVLHGMGVQRLGLVGGEPMLRKDLPDIVRSARDRGFYVMVNSNLTLMDRNPGALADVDAVFTSLDGSTAAEHEVHRGRRAFAGVLEAIRLLVARGKPVVAICVVTDENVGTAASLLALAEREGFRVHFQPRCHDAEIVRGRSLLARDRKLEGLWVELLAAKTAGAPVASSTAYLQHQAKWLDFGVSARFEADTRCAAGRGFIFVDPMGVASPCSFTKGKTRGVHLLQEAWVDHWDGRTPCTACSVGPFVEFNLLFQSPHRVAFDLVDAYG